MLEEDEGSLAVAYPLVVGEGCVVLAAVSKADAGVFVDVGMIVVTLTLYWYLGIWKTELAKKLVPGYYYTAGIILAKFGVVKLKLCRHDNEDVGWCACNEMSGGREASNF